MFGKRYIRAMVLAALLMSVGSLQAQEWSVKTNLLSDVLTVPSVSSEYRISLRWTASVEAAWMPIRQSQDHFLRTFKLQPEAHYWLRAPFTGPFIGRCSGACIIWVDCLPSAPPTPARRDICWVLV